MNYRILGKTGFSVSEVGLGTEWLERHDRDEVIAVIKACQDGGINILDCWMAEPNVRTNIGLAIKGSREKWHLMGHLGSTQQNGQYVRTRDMKFVVPAFEDFMTRMQTDYVDIGCINYVDALSDLDEVMNGEMIKYARELKKKGIIRAIGMSTHNPIVGKAAVLSGELDTILFSINPAFDMRPPSEDVNDLFSPEYDGHLSGIAPERAELYKLCEREGVGITVMKGYGGGRLFDPELSPFKVALTPSQCIHYALTRPAVASVMVGVETLEQVAQALEYVTATDEEKDYASVLAKAPMHAFTGQCTYCGHCAPCPVGIDVAMVNKLADLAEMSGAPTPSLASHYVELDANASDCLSCGGCEERCPFGVKVVERMARTRELFSK